MPTAIIFSVLALGQINGEFKPPTVDFPAVTASADGASTAPGGQPATATNPSGAGLPAGTGSGALPAGLSPPPANFGGAGEFAVPGSTTSSTPGTTASGSGTSPAPNGTAGLGAPRPATGSPVAASGGLNPGITAPPNEFSGAGGMGGEFRPGAVGSGLPRETSTPTATAGAGSSETSGATPSSTGEFSMPSGGPGSFATPGSSVGPASASVGGPTIREPAPLNLSDEPAGNFGHTLPPGTQPTAATQPTTQPTAAPLEFSGRRGAGSVSPAAASGLQPLSNDAPTGLNANTNTTPSRESVLTRGQPRSAAEAILQEQLGAAALKPFNGQPQTLVDALMRVDDSAGRLNMVKKYWMLSAAVAWHSVCEEHVNFLREIQQPASPMQQSRLQAAVTAAQARAREAKLAAVGIQYELAEAARMLPNEPLPLPADLPWVGAYNTRINELFSGQTPPLPLARLDATLPEFQGVIEAAAESMLSSREYRENAFQSLQNGQVPLDAVLAAAESSVTESKALLTATRNYNLSIGDYALTVAGGGVDRRTVASMLIPVPDNEKSVLISNNSSVVPAAAHLPVPPGSSELTGSQVTSISPAATVPGAMVPSQMSSESLQLPPGATNVRITPISPPAGMNAGAPVGSNFGSGKPTPAAPPAELTENGLRGFETR